MERLASGEFRAASMPCEPGERIRWYVDLQVTEGGIALQPAAGPVQAFSHRFGGKKPK
jgi:hypothetical protein